ncbi:hypothetical protein MM300_15075 [Evansella sp. LMS18]|uniref:hypothetical protein n=1 Tax=Evansella sp. LMS18 TaxID=2924033 RepID=UPI0020CFEE1F|nr:hypothetical protein [Evansella sp. LMS18]UTR09216.1 hypothetical protein MM300_15075 [Evansella sp. LMS18]
MNETIHPLYHGKFQPQGINARRPSFLHAEDTATRITYASIYISIASDTKEKVPVTEGPIFSPQTTPFFVLFAFGRTYMFTNEERTNEGGWQQWRIAY